jgi:AcrR family transcriptional regulator
MKPQATSGAAWPVREKKKSGRPARETRPTLDLDAVIDAALRVFNQHGFEATSMQDIAREAGLSKSSIYHHVSSKEELLARALERAFVPLFAIFDDPLAMQRDALDCLKFVFHRVILITLQFNHEVDLLQRIKGNSPTERAALERRHRVDRAVAIIARTAIRAGQLRPDIDPALLTRLLFGMSNSATQWYQPGGKLSPEEIADAMLKLVFEGIALA